MPLTFDRIGGNVSVTRRQFFVCRDRRNSLLIDYARDASSLHEPEKRALDFATLVKESSRRLSLRVEHAMGSKLKLARVTGLLLAGSVSSASAMAADWTAREAELVGLHQLCDKGDRRACVRFGMMLGEAKERHTEWRKAHAEWWWWEH